MSSITGQFSVKKITSFKTLRDCPEENIVLPESDLCFQDGEYIYQFDYKKPSTEDKYEIEPGSFLIEETNSGVALSKYELKDRSLLDTASNTQKITKEADIFFSRLHVYDKLNRPKKRGVLLYSYPGMGKTSAIERFCKTAINQDPGTVVLIWPTSDVDSDSVAKFLGAHSTFKSECTKLILIIEDIGGGEREGSYSRSGVDSGLLNLLDGVGLLFKLPTFIVATTNHPENLLESLADRPGRFDLMIKLDAPSAEERIKLLTFIAKRDLSAEEVSAISAKALDKFSIAHLEEIAVRSELHDKTYKQVIDELVEHQKRYTKGFEERRSVGLE
jgi:SpoVK/Ycf46/Vps4 family AAA+-type ATPase